MQTTAASGTVWAVASVLMQLTATSGAIGPNKTGPTAPALDWQSPMADEQRDDRIITPTQLQPTQIDLDQALLRDEDLLNEEHLRRMDQVLLRRNLDHARMFSRKLSLELQQFVHLYTPEANELRRRIEKYMIMEQMIEREMARRHTY
jgi:U3 small nucleolar RNA-associated protein 14